MAQTTKNELRQRHLSTVLETVSGQFKRPSRVRRIDVDQDKVGFAMLIKAEKAARA